MVEPKKEKPQLPDSVWKTARKTPRRLEKALSNLFSYAIKLAPPNSRAASLIEIGG
jgi:hypothetical protein